LKLPVVLHNELDLDHIFMWQQVGLFLYLACFLREFSGFLAQVWLASSCA
jgi:hypothetical protein